MRRAAARVARCCRVRPHPREQSQQCAARRRRHQSRARAASGRRCRRRRILPQRSRDDPGLYRVATVPNALSAFRIAAAPAVGALVWHGHHDAAALAGCALSLTDWLDGYLAQKLDQETILGKFLDPLGDKALVCCVGVPLALRGELPLALVGLVVARDVGLVFGTRQALSRGKPGPRKPTTRASSCLGAWTRAPSASTRRRR